VVAAGAARVELRALEHGAHLLDRVVELAVEAPVDGRRAGRRQGQPEENAQRGRLPRAVGPEEAEDVAGARREREPVDRHVRAEALREVADLEHASHHTSRP
jgi:hypothetical protein